MTITGEAPLHRLVGHRLPDLTRTWTDVDTMHYALAVGAGHADPAAELQLTTENTRDQCLQPLPTLGIVLAGAPDALLDAAGVSGGQVLLIADEIRMDRPLPPAGTLHARTEISQVLPHRRGSVVVTTGTARSDEDGATLFRTISKTLVRSPALEHAEAENAEPGTRRTSTPSATAAPAAPTDHSGVTFDVPANQALLYRLVGGRNPLHSDPQVAIAAGFDRPILQGRCTLGYAARLLVHEVCGGDPARLRTVGARMTGPVWPGDRLRLHVQRPAEDGAGTFEMRRVDDNRPVLDQGVYECQT